MHYVAAVDCGDEIMVKCRSKYMTIDPAEYYAWHLANRSSINIIAVASFKYSKDITFESLLSVPFRLDNMWRDDMLAYWHWQRNKTGLATYHERLDALETAAKVLMANAKT